MEFICLVIFIKIEKIKKYNHEKNYDNKVVM